MRVHIVGIDIAKSVFHLVALDEKGDQIGQFAQKCGIPRKGKLNPRACRMAKPTASNHPAVAYRVLLGKMRRL